MNDFLKDKMSLNKMEINQPDPSLVSEARKKVVLRKKVSVESESIFSTLGRFFNLQIKLYQAVLATIIIAAGIFYFSNGDGGKKDDSRKIQYANADSLRSSSVKDNSILVKNFVTTVN